MDLLASAADQEEPCQDLPEVVVQTLLLWQYLVVWMHPVAWTANVGIHGRAVSVGGDLLGKEAGLRGLFADHAAVASGWLGDYLAAFDDCTGGSRM